MKAAGWTVGSTEEDGPEPSPMAGCRQLQPYAPQGAKRNKSSKSAYVLASIT